jgi:hypothetical protein
VAAALIVIGIAEWVAWPSEDAIYRFGLGFFAVGWVANMLRVLDD